MRIFALVFLLLPACGLTSAEAAFGKASDPGKQKVYFGTYTGKLSRGIYYAELDLKNGALSQPILAGEITNPSFLALHSRDPLLYAVSEVSTLDGQKTGGVTAFKRDPETGMLEVINQQPSGGGGPCHLVIDGAGRHVLAANYGGGSVVVLPLALDGRLESASSFIQHTGSGTTPRQKAPHAHSINVHRSQRYAVAADLGLDKLLVYQFDPGKGTLTPSNPPAATLKPGSGPRHFAFHPKKDFGYSINELNCTVTAFSFDAKAGQFEELQTISSLPPDQPFQSGYSTAEVQVHPSGLFLYGSNRGHDSIVVFAIDPKKGTLKHLENEPTGGKTPRNFGIDPTGKYLLAANQGSDSVVVFRIDPATGRLQPTGHSIEVGSPVCVKFVDLKR